MMSARSLDSGFAEDDAGDFFGSNARAILEPDAGSIFLSSASATARARDLILGDPTLRSKSASAVAKITGLPVTSVQAAIHSIVQGLAGGRALTAVPANASLDDALVKVGAPAPAASSPNWSAAPSGTVRRHIALRPLNKEGFSALLDAVPPLQRLPGDMLNLISGVGMIGPEDASGIDPSNPAIYIVEAGDNPSLIAQKLTGASNRWPELVNANVPPKTKNAQTGNFNQLFAGEKLKLPPSWVVAAPVPNQPPPIPGLPPVPGLPAGTQFDYIVQAGDFPFKVAQTLTGNGGRWTELKTANPQKAIQGPGDPQPGNFKQFNAGEVLHLPDSWGALISVPPPFGVIPRAGQGLPVPPGLPPVPPQAPPPAPAPGPQIPVPAPPGGFSLPPGQVAVPVPGLPPGTTADAGVYAQTQALLAAWTKYNTRPPPAAPADFGTFPGEFTGAETPRSRQSIQSYQIWANVNKTQGLRTDGTLDTATYLSLTVTVGELLAARPGGAGTGPDGGPKKSDGGAGLLAIGGLLVGGLTLLK